MSPSVHSPGGCSEWGVSRHVTPVALYIFACDRDFPTISASDLVYMEAFLILFNLENNIVSVVFLGQSTGGQAAQAEYLPPV